MQMSIGKMLFIAFVLKLKKDFNDRSVENNVVKMATCMQQKYMIYKTLFLLARKSNGIAKPNDLKLPNSQVIISIIIIHNINDEKKPTLLHCFSFNPYEDFEITKYDKKIFLQI